MQSMMSAAPVPDGIRPAYYTTDDISVIMRCHGDKAREIARGFEARGQAVRNGRRLMVPVEIFDAWRRETDGTVAFFRPPLRAIEGGKASPDRRTKLAKLEEENKQLRDKIEELTRPKKRGRPPKAAAART